MRLKLLTSILILFSSTFMGMHSYADDEADRARLVELKKSIAEVKAQLETTKSSRDALLKSLEDSEKDIGELSKQADDIKTRLEEGKKRLQELQIERDGLQVKKKTQQNFVSQHINSAWRMGQQGNIRLLLNQQDPATVSRNLKYYDYLIRARAEKISAFVATITRINTIEPEIAAETDKLQRNHKKLQNRRQELRSSQQQRKLTLAKLDSSIASKDQQLTGLRNDRSRLERILANVSRFMDDIEMPGNAKPFASRKGKLLWPTQGRVIRNYGTQRVANRLKWEGMLIQATTGNPVVAVHHGRIVFSDYLRGHGLLIIIDHGAGYMTLYAHNQALYKEIGEWVDGGDRIATVGASGGQQKSALYFELRHKGQPTNPKRWFKAA